MSTPECLVADVIEKEVPSTLKFIENEFQPGLFIVGSSKFILKSVEILDVFHRKFGDFEEILLGLLSVILIAIIAEIFQTLLLRTTRNHVSINWLVSAFLVDEFLHFRNGFRNYRPRSNTSRQREVENNLQLTLEQQRNGNLVKTPWYKRRVFLIIMALFISLLLLSAEVVTVLLTQQSSKDSQPNEYNLQAKQPISTGHGLQQFIRRSTSNTPCISPLLLNETGVKRNYVLSSCVIYSEKRDLLNDDDIAETISLWSFFHKAGSDHRFEMREAVLNVSIRSTIQLSKEIGGSQYLEYETQYDPNLEITKYFHRLTMAHVVQSNCNKKLISPPAKKFFNELNTTHTIVKEDILAWTGKEGEEYVNNTIGLKTVWKGAIPNPYNRLRGAIWPLIASGVIEEVEKSGAYVSVDKNRRSTQLPGLITEEGRIAGVYLFLIVISTSLVFLIVLKWCLKPVSLGYLALTGIEQQYNVNLVPDDHHMNVWMDNQARSNRDYNHYWEFGNMTISREDDVEYEEYDLPA